MLYAVEKWNAKIDAWQQVGEITMDRQRAKDAFEVLRNKFDFEHFRFIEIIFES